VEDTVEDVSAATTLTPRLRQLLSRAFLEENTVFKALSTVRTRRVGLGYRLETGREETFTWSSGKTVVQPRGPLAYESSREPIPLTELEQALLAWAACGPNGVTSYDVPVSGGLSTFVCNAGFTIPSAAATPSLALVIIDDAGTWFYRPPTDRQKPVEITDESDLDKILSWYKGRVLLSDRRPDVGWMSAPEGTHKLNALGPAQYNLNRPGSTWFVPVGDLGLEWFNLLLAAYEWWGFYLQDPDTDKAAGCEPWIKPGFLEAPLPIPTFDELVLMLHASQVGAAVQNIRLACEFMGLGAWPVGTYADDFLLGAYPEVARGLGFSFVERRGPNPTKTFSCTGLPGVFDAVAVPTERFPDSSSAVEYVKDLRYRPGGTLDRELATEGGSSPASTVLSVQKMREILETPQAWISEWTVEAAVATVDYIVSKYGIAPAFISPVRAKFSCQVHHVDVEYYRKFGRGDSPLITPAIEAHLDVWHT
jgi:nitroreductase